MALPRVRVEIHPPREMPRIGSVLDELLKHDTSAEGGAVLFYVGRVKGRSRDGRKVAGLSFPYSIHDLEEKVNQALSLCPADSIISVEVHHMQGVAEPGEVVMIIGVLGITRMPAIECLKQIVNYVKELKHVELL